MEPKPLLTSQSLNPIRFSVMLAVWPSGRLAVGMGFGVTNSREDMPSVPAVALHCSQKS